MGSLRKVVESQPHTVDRRAEKDKDGPEAHRQRLADRQVGEVAASLVAPVSASMSG